MARSSHASIRCRVTKSNRKPATNMAGAECRRRSCRSLDKASRTMKSMNETVVRAAGLGITIVYASLIAWLFVRQPATFAEVTGGLSSAVGAYRIDRQAFDDGLLYFRNDQFAEARAAFDRADPARRDALTQFH